MRQVKIWVLCGKRVLFQGNTSITTEQWSPSVFWFKFPSHSTQADGSQHWSSPGAQSLCLHCSFADLHLRDLSLAFAGNSYLAFHFGLLIAFLFSVTILPWALLVTVLQLLCNTIQQSCASNFKPVVCTTLNLAKWYPVQFFLCCHQMGYLVFGEFQCPPVSGCSHNFGVLKEDECVSFYSAFLNSFFFAIIKSKLWPPWRDSGHFYLNPCSLLRPSFHTGWPISFLLVLTSSSSKQGYAQRLSVNSQMNFLKGSFHIL